MVETREPEMRSPVQFGERAATFVREVVSGDDEHGAAETWHRDAALALVTGALRLGSGPHAWRKGAVHGLRVERTRPHMHLGVAALQLGRWARLEQDDALGAQRRCGLQDDEAAHAPAAQRDGLGESGGGRRDGACVVVVRGGSDVEPSLQVHRRHDDAREVRVPSVEDPRAAARSVDEDQRRRGSRGRADHAEHPRSRFPPRASSPAVRSRPHRRRPVPCPIAPRRQFGGCVREE